MYFKANMMATERLQPCSSTPVHLTMIFMQTDPNIFARTSRVHSSKQVKVPHLQGFTEEKKIAADEGEKGYVGSESGL